MSMVHYNTIYTTFFRKINTLVVKVQDKFRYIIKHKKHTQKIMALSPQLLNFKSSGVYRLEFDKSQTANINVETLRLVVGHSRKGPYNTPVLIDSQETFNNVFGSIDKGLEKKGMFFHRSCIEALSRGPILALNLGMFEAADVANYTAPSTTGSVDGNSSIASSAEYTKFFDNDKFMIPSDTETLETIATTGDNNLLNFVNIKQDSITIIVRQAADVAEFNSTARDWYGQGNVPEYLNDFDRMSDYMMDVFVFKGEFDAASMANDPIYSKFFTTDGLDKAKLNEFANLRQVTLLAQYTGSILPGFKDLEGRNLYIESMVNAEARRTGLFCAVDEDKVIDENGTNIDFVGHIVDEDQDFELLSHAVKQTVVANTPTVDLTSLGTAYTISTTTLTIEGTDATSSFTEGEFLEGATLGEYVEITDVDYTSPDTVITCDGNIIPSPSDDAVFPSYTVSNSRVTEEDFSTGTGAIEHTSGNTDFTVTYTNANTPTSVFPISIGDYINSVTSGRIARVNKVSKSIGTADTVYTIYTDVEPDYNNQIIKSFENASDYYKTFVLSKAKISVKNLSDYLATLTGGMGLYDALIDKDIIDFRYVVDTFASFDENGLNNKHNLSQLAKDRMNASAIVNAPTVEDFKKSKDPSFTDANKSFSTSYVKDGGNQDKNPTGNYALPSIAQGANYAFYFAPGLIVSDNGKDIIVPMAAYISNNYMDKYTNALPWSIVAGPRRGVVAGANVKGVEYSFDKSDRDNLEPFGINPVVFQRGVGLTILGNKTAQQSIKSALSSAHVREAMIYIQDGMAQILKDYVFEFNNTQTRLEIKTLADSFLESIKQDGGVYEFKNVMDSTNNTNEVIDNNMGIIDTFVEPVKGLEIVVHRTTILNTGDIQSGNL